MLGELDLNAAGDVCCEQITSVAGGSGHGRRHALGARKFKCGPDRGWSADCWQWHQANGEIASGAARLGIWRAIEPHSDVNGTKLCKPQPGGRTTNATPPRKDSILAGGSGTRLYEVATAVYKQLLPVDDKPMIYYPLTMPTLANIHDILIIFTPHDTPRFEDSSSDGSQWRIKFQYAVQSMPDCLLRAFISGREFVDDAPSAFILADNIYFDNDFEEQLCMASNRTEGTAVFAYHVRDPERDGVVDLTPIGNNRQLWISKGFEHGFIFTSDSA